VKESRGVGLSTKSLLRRDLMDSTDFGESIRHTSGFVGATEYTVWNRFDEMDEKSTVETIN
jgi:monoamine oxidase